jgi:hypothetical protein
VLDSDTAAEVEAHIGLCDGCLCSGVDVVCSGSVCACAHN